MNLFDRSKHVYTSSDFEEIIKDTIRFFNGTPVHPVPPPERFRGTGVYALYCIMKTGAYAKYHEINRVSYLLPIYVGKAVPKGWRQARMIQSVDANTYELYGRLKEHVRSIEQGTNLNLSEFYCRFMILEQKESDLIGTVEAALIRQYKPLWNVILDGFGNHDPGSGRYEQTKSDWDVLHPGRPWADRCKGKPTKKSELTSIVNEYFRDVVR